MYTDLTLIVFGPLVLGLGLLLTRYRDRRTMFEWALGSSVVPFLYSLSLLRSFNPGDPSFQCLTPERMRNWIVIADSIKIEYLLGIDGISIFLVLLTTLLTPVAILGATASVRKNFRGYLFSILALETCVLGCLTALDLFLFYTFWTLSFIPLFFLTGVWGLTGRVRSATRFFLFSMLGTVLLLAAILVLHSLSYQNTFNFIGLLSDPNINALGISAQSWLFWGFILAFAVRASVFPFHTWLPDTSAESPSAGVFLVNSIFLATGIYAILRFCLPLFPDAAHLYAPLFCILAVIGIIYGAGVASVQLDFRRFIAYISICHVGFIILGIFVFTASSITGAVLHTINLAIFIAALVLVSEFLYFRRSTCRIANFGGIITVMPVLGGFFLVTAAAAMCLPGLNTFVSGFLVFLGVFENGLKGNTLYLVLGSFAVTGFIWLAVALIRTFQKIMLGKITHEDNRLLRDLYPRETAAILILVLLMFVTGFFSNFLTSRMDTSVQRTLTLSASDIDSAPPTTENPAPASTGTSGFTEPEGPPGRAVVIPTGEFPVSGYEPDVGEVQF